MILFAYGTRPEHIKITPLVKLLSKSSYKTLFTGQHQELVTQTEFDYRLSILNGDNRLDSVIQSCLNIEHIFDGITHVLVQGDTTSALGIALAAFHRKIQVIHLEAGLRSYDLDNPYPEEANRLMISRLANYHLCPTENNKNNLIEEKVKTGKIFVVGNTGLDNLVQLKEKVSLSNKVLVTLHRRENHDSIMEWFDKIDTLAKSHPELEFILPIHPNPSVKKHAHLLKYVKVIDPMAHKDLLDLLVTCRLVISDSGGIQEECSFFNKKILVCRKTTERPESVGVTSFLVDINNIADIFEEHIKNPTPDRTECPYGDGSSSKKITKIFKSETII